MNIIKQLLKTAIFYYAFAVILGFILAIIGVYILFGVGWAFIAASITTTGTGFTLLRGSIIPEH